MMLPFGFTYGSRNGQLKGWVTSYYINFAFDEKLVRIPKKLIK